ncbi:trypsin-like serine peptidase [Actinomadura rudentiformis]|uniref:Trypsin-like serine protease n=1 Tax=Actinomadura rudentiformis TaxID=359158 RepID=A0A6H9YNM6_9ACTN|nr:hypothetical protein [Actinomadura rudentiformis]KAB2340552.1 hypothetical protein F8566_44250 [Actinomadura rudentiformis]
MTTRRGTVLLAMAVAAAPLTAGPAHALDATDPWAAVTGTQAGISPLSSAEVEAYWTPERMATAIPVEPPVPTADDSPAPPSTSGESGDGFVPAAVTPQATPGTLALDYFSASKLWSGHGKMPASTIGKLFYTNNGTGYSCSAAVINSSNRNTIWTAGHCVSSGNKRWYTNFAFVPDYHDGKRPHGTWTGKSWSVPNGYHDGKKHRYDMAAIALNTSGGRKVGDVVGYQGYRFGEAHNETTFHDVRAFGYPSKTHPPRDGISTQKLRFCVGAATPDALYRRIGCDMGSGSSGGPWITGMPLSRGWGYIIGHQGWNEGPGVAREWSPTLGTAAINVRNAVHRD